MRFARIEMMRLTINIKHFITMAAILAIASTTEYETNVSSKNASILLNSTAIDSTDMNYSLPNVSGADNVTMDTNELSGNSSDILESETYYNSSQRPSDEVAETPNPVKSLANQTLTVFENSTAFPLMISDESNCTRNPVSEGPTSPRPLIPMTIENVTKTTNTVDSTNNTLVTVDESNSTEYEIPYSPSPPSSPENSVSPIPKVENFIMGSTPQKLALAIRNSTESVSVSTTSAPVLMSTMQEPNL